MSLARIEELLDALDADAPADVTMAVRELVALLLDAHRQGMTALVGAAGDALRAAGVDEDAPPFTTRVLDDPLVRDLLLLHDLHPDPPSVRAEAAITALHTELGASAEGLVLIRCDEEALEVSLPGVTAEVGRVVLERLTVLVPDAGPARISELPTRRLLPMLGGSW